MSSRPGPRVLRWGVGVGVGAGLAAAAALVLLAVRLGLPPGDVSPPAVTAMQIKDINRDGRVDILDAFALARRIERGEALDAAWDFTGDGTIGPGDVERVAMAAVRLEGGVQ